MTAKELQQNCKQASENQSPSDDEWRQRAALQAMKSTPLYQF